MPSYRTIPARTRIEIDRIKGSRFIGTAWPIENEGECEAMVAAHRGEMPDATHHCWAFRVDGDLARSSDDGEPRGSAGIPILKRIEGLDLYRVCVVVSRYFGGTKLGTGGLVRAYGECARAVLDEAGGVERIAQRRIRLSFPYELSGVIKGVLLAHDAGTVDSAYGESVDLVVDVPEDGAPAFIAELIERTAGRIVTADVG